MSPNNYFSKGVETTEVTLAAFLEICQEGEVTSVTSTVMQQYMLATI
jgi:hypothetical protein